MTLADALQYVEDCLQPRLAWEISGRSELRGEARALLKAAAHVSDAEIIGHADTKLDAQAWERVRSIAQRRSQGEPLAYIEGRRGFHAIELQVDSNVLIPRPETELVVDAVLERATDAAFSVADVGTGSGAIALALANARSDASVVGIDISPAALAVARTNGDSLGLKVEWIESDWFDGVAGRRFDFICCNPPYVCSRDPHLNALSFEPLLALDGGGDGLDAIRLVLGSSAEHLKLSGSVLLEHGYDQAEEAARIAAAAGLSRVDTLRDLGGHERVSIFRRLS